MKKYILFLFVAIAATGYGQLMQWTPYFAVATDSITITFDATQGNAGLSGYAGDVYAHTGVITNLSTSSSDWKYVKTNWGVNTPETKLTRIGTDLYQFKIQPNIRAYYNVPGTETILKLAFVFRSSAAPFREGKTADGGDIFIPLATAGLNAAVTQPTSFPFISTVSAAFTVQVQSAQSTTLALYIDNVFISQTTTNSIIYSYTPATAGKKWIKAVASNGTTTKYDSVAVVIRPPVTTEALPAGIVDGINYSGNVTSATLCLYAPQKEFVYIIGDFSNWDAAPEYYMKRTPDGSRFWLTINNLSPATEYAFQYYVEGKLRIADPYAEKILDPWNDKYILSITYPNLKAYPAGKTSQLVSVLQTAQSAYNWQVANFTKPPKDNLVIYELLMRDFIEAHSYQSLIDTLNYLKTLGVNAIELMPVNEFDGNESWGYNPALSLAPDKYYGPKNDFKKFVDLCHQNGIAVIMDVVFNHAFGNSPLVRLYWDAVNNQPAANSPWFNQTAKHPYSIGYDFNHESQATKDFMDRALKFWMTDYKIDGFRFDLSKGFTQKYTGSDVGAWGQYDQSRIDILKRMADKVWQTNANEYVILEHFADNSEEIVLANYGMLIWGKMNSQYNEATMGYHDNNKSDFSWISHKNRGWAQANCIGYMESHDEERLMYKNLQYGNSSGTYNIKTLSTALDRMKMAGAFFFPVPGPKMMWQFGELGYDFSIQYPCGTDNCRTDKKPIRWDYYSAADRYKLYRVYSYLINLKKTYPAFRSNDFTLAVNGALKRINISHASMNVSIIGNFNVTAGTIAGNFNSTGLWYDYFSGNSINVTDPYAQMTLQPGEFHIYTNVKLPTPEPGLITDVAEYHADQIPTHYLLEQNYPNPFNPTTAIKFNLPEKTNVSLVIYDQLGEKVTTLINGALSAGYHQVEWDASNMTSGIYFYEIKTNNFSAVKKLILMK